MGRLHQTQDAISVLNNKVTLSDGRMLAFAEYGPVEGRPVMMFHGAPGSRHEHVELAALQKTDTRLIVVDRPGYGRSDFYADRSLLDWPEDIRKLADFLHLGRFTVMGFSGGGPYAAACARKIPERLSRVVLLGSLAPFDVNGFAEMMPPASRALFELAAQDVQLAELQLTELSASPLSLFNTIEDAVSAADKSVFNNPGFRRMYLDNLTEACCQGPAGFAHDMRILAQPWGFDPASIDADVTLWHGTQDNNVPPAMGRYLADAIPRCQAHFIPDTGHCFMFHQWSNIFQ